MALEFDCPYCKATIRVPDNTAGKRGRCPQCAAKLTIPKLGQTRRAGTEQPFFPEAPDPAAVAPQVPEQDAEVVFEEFNPSQPVGIDPAVAAALAPGDVALPDLGTSAPSSLPKPVIHLPDSLLSKSKSRRRRTPVWVWMIIAILMIGGGGVAGAVYWFQFAVTLTGEFEGQLVENPPPPTTAVPRSLIDMSPADTEQVIDSLERNPRTLSSTVGLATVQFQGSDRGLLVTVQPGAATALYRVEFTGDKKLRKYLRDHVQNYERIRQENLSLAVNELFRTLKRGLKAKKQTAAELQEFRDSVGFTAPVRGLGHFVQAAHRKQVYPCVYEDDEALYFLLPPGTKQFAIQGKPRQRGEPFFPGVYQVEVTGSMKLSDAGEPTPPEPTKQSKPKDEDASMSEDENEDEPPAKK